MDWKYIYSLKPNTINDEEKESLLNTIAWFDTEVEDVDLKKCSKLLILSQEIMKYKSEQVEALVAELDEVAKKQAENELKKIDDFDNRSVKSRKSSSIDVDEVEERYREMKQKLRQQNRNKDKLKHDIDKLKKYINTLEQDRTQLQNELQSLQRDESQSDISETTKDQNRELINSVRQKNNQISQLLNDIEIIESENIKLKEQLTKVRDELDDATKQITKMTDRFVANDIEIKEKSEKIQNVTQQVEALKSQIDEIDSEKDNYKKQLQDFALEIDSRVDEWRKIIDDKNDEIKELTSKIGRDDKSSTESLSNKDFKSQISTLNKIILTRDEKIYEIQKQLQSATEEMTETTEFLRKLTQEKEDYIKQLKTQKRLLKELKSQVKNNHTRCQDLQEEVKYLQGLSEKKDKDINEIIKKIKENGQSDLSELLENIQNLKSQKRYKDKHISELVRNVNKLQDAFEQTEKENTELRSRLGLSEDEAVSIVTIETKHKKQKKLIQELHTKSSKLEEEKLNLRLEVQKQTKIINGLTKQLNELDVTPVIDDLSELDPEKVEIQDGVSKEMHQAVVEENEALRKGLHEILESLQSRKEKGYREIKSEKLEELLKALDTKHISGWYHPAMRLQAEIHTLQGINSELREQLRITRTDLKNSKQPKEDTTHHFSIQNLNKSDEAETVSELKQHLSNVLQEHNKLNKQNEVLTKKLVEFKTNFDQIQQQMSLLYQQYSTDKQGWMDEKQKLFETTNDVTEKVEVLEAKLREISKFNLTDEEQLKVRQISEMAGNLVVLNRKSVYLENENKKLLVNLSNVKNDLLNAEVFVMKKVAKMMEERSGLLHKIEVLENNLKNKIGLALHVKLQNDFDDLTLAHRAALNKLNEITTNNNSDFEVLERKVELAKEEKKVLLNKNQELLSKINSFEISSFEIDKATEILTRKLSQSEINEITERQRANHMENLYELVKEQLKKSEERYKEFECYNKEIMQKNLTLQESIKDQQNKIINAVDIDEYDHLRVKYQELLKTNEKLSNEVQILQNQNDVTQKNYETHKLWTSAHEYEFLSLKHQILDLQASSDDKAVISRLSTDVVQARLMEAETQKKLESLQKQLQDLQSEYEAYKITNEEQNELRLKTIDNLQVKVSSLQEIVKQQRQQYFGCIPLISETKFIENIIQIYDCNHGAFLKLQSCDYLENDAEILKEQLKEQLKTIEEIKSTNSSDFQAKITKWYNDKCIIQLQELKYRRKSEFIQTQLDQALEKIKLQDQHMAKLEEALYLAYQNVDVEIPKSFEGVKLQPVEEKVENFKKEIDDKVKVIKSEETQTIYDLDQSDDDSLQKLQIELIETQKQVTAKEEAIEQLKLKITELEMNLSLFRNQLGDKQSQISFYEKHIMELQSKKDGVPQEKDEVDITSNEDYLALKATATKLQNLLHQKEEAILKYQSLLKQDRDEHSLAAERMQEELKRLQNVLTTHQQAYKELKECQKEPNPGKVAVEQYIKQVHALEKHTAELHSTVISLENQLQCCREESVRWRSLANDRLESIEKIRLEMEQAHKDELQVYKDDCEKWRQEVVSMQAFVSKYQENKTDMTAEIQKLVKEKDDRIHELTVHLRQLRVEVRKKMEIPESPKLAELESEKEMLIKDLDGLRRRFEMLLNKERNAKEEIRNLKAQLMKRPIITSARSDKSDTMKDHLLKKISVLEKDNADLRENLQQQLLLHETHRLKVAEDFDKWNKQKFFQQLSEKLKIKLKEKTEEFEKLQQTCSGYRILIERLEREKHALESKNKNLRTTTNHSTPMKCEILEIENEKLQTEIESLRAKMEIQQHHSGALGAAMLQEKLQAQERKLAILELAAKGTGEFRAEMERLHSNIANLQKQNLRLEAENLEFKLDLEKSTKELPHLREQIQHLEEYIEILKTENYAKHEVSNCGDHATPEPKRISELERTVFVLKRIVEKLQAENKRLQGGGRICNEKVSDDTLRRDFYRLKGQYGDCIQKVARLEDELNVANTKLKQMKTKTQFTQELDEVKAQLSQKTELLEKVKVLLHRAATKEKALLEEISRLKTMLPSSTTSFSSN